MRIARHLFYPGVRPSPQVLFVVVLGCAACGADRDLVLAIPNLEVAVLYTEAAVGPATVEVVHLTSAEPSRRLLTEDVTLAVVVGVERSRIADRLPDFEPGRSSEISARFGAPSPDPGITETIDGRVFRQITLPEDAETWSARFSAGDTRGFVADPAALASVRPQVSLVVPTSSESCPPPGGPLRVFADVPDTYVIGVRRVAGDLMVVDALTHLVIVRRGGEILSSIEASAVVPGGDLAEILNLQRDPRARPDGHHRLWAAACSAISVDDRTCSNGSGRLIEIDVGTDGSSQVRTATVMASGPGFLSVAIDDLGRILIIQGAGAVFTLEGDPPALIALPSPEIGASSTRPDRLVSTEDPRNPFLAGYKSSVNLFDWTERRWRRWVVGGNELVSTYGIASHLDAVSGDLEIWTGGNRGRLFRRLPNQIDFARIDPILPLAMAPCANADRHGIDDVGDLVLDADAAYLIYNRCSAAARVRRRDLCAATLIEPGLVPEQSVDRPMAGLDLAHGWVSITRQTDRGTRIYELPVQVP